MTLTEMIEVPSGLPQTTQLTAVEFRVGAGVISLLLMLVGWALWRLFLSHMQNIQDRIKVQEKVIEELGEDLLTLGNDLDNGIRHSEAATREWVNQHIQPMISRIQELREADSRNTQAYAELRLIVQDLKNKFENQEKVLVRVEENQELVLKMIAEIATSLGGRRKQD